MRPAAESVDLPDPDDAVYLQTALAGQAEVLVTGNRKHFPAREYRRVLILFPREFLDFCQGAEVEAA